MDIQHLRYIAEIARTGSMTQAAANLYMTQPNLSRAVRELEGELRIAIFNRTSKGVTLTREGTELLRRTSDLLTAFEHLEAHYRPDDGTVRRFSLSAPRALYLSCAFSAFVRATADAASLQYDFRETGPNDALDDVVQRRQNMAIVRFPAEHERYFKRMFKSLGLYAETLLDFDERVLCSQDSPLARKSVLTADDLRPMTELVCDDPPIASAGIPAGTPRGGSGAKKLYLQDRGSRCDLLRAVPESYLWSSPAPESALAALGLVSRPAPAIALRQQDALVHPKDYRLSLTDQLFLKELYALTLTLGAS